MIAELMERDHQELSALLNDLRFALDQQNQPETFQLLDLFWARLAVHIRAENLCLFPALLRAFAEGHPGIPTHDQVKSAIETLRSDHNFFMDQLAKAVNMLRDLQPEGGDAPGTLDACEAVRTIVGAVAERLREHDRLEEEQVYKWTDNILSAAAADFLTGALRHELQNMPPRFSH